MVACTGVVAAKIATGAVTTDAMAANSVATASVIDDAITTAKIVDQSRSEEFSDCTTTFLRCCYEDPLQTVELPLIGGGYSENADDAITSAKISDGALLTAHYAAGSVDAAALGEHQSFLWRIKNKI